MALLIYPALSTRISTLFLLRNTVSQEESIENCMIGDGKASREWRHLFSNLYSE